MQPADFHFLDRNWKKHFAELPPLDPKTPRSLGYGGRDYQIRRHEALNEKTRTVTISPTGSGKSLMQIMDAAREIIQTDYSRKQVFIVPQINIGYGFSHFKHPKLNIDGKVFSWEIEADCCVDNNGSVAKIRKFLLSKPHPCKSHRKMNVLGGVTSIVTYAAFVAAFQDMSDSEKRRAIRNTSFRIDEVQHIAGVCDEEYLANRMGEFCKYLLDNGGFLHLMTATFFRGNRQVVIDQDYLKDFTIFRVEFMDHWKVLGLSELRQTYHAYKNGTDLMQQIVTAIEEEPDECSLVIVPTDGTGIFKTTKKPLWVVKLVKKLEAIYGRDAVLDLVSPERQEKDKARLMSEKQDFKAVVTCMIGREGADWPPCSRVHNTVFDRAVLVGIQKLGRALRQYNGKTDVKMFNYVEHFPKWNSSHEKIRAKISDRFNAVLLASMLDDMFYPILMPTLPAGSGEKPKAPVKHVTLEDLYGTKRNDVIEQLLERVLQLPEDRRTVKAIDGIIDDIIEDFSECVQEDVAIKDIKDRLRKELLRRQQPSNPDLRYNDMIVKFVRENGWDKVVREHIAPHAPFVGRANTSDLEELQKFLQTDWWTKVKEALGIGLENLERGTPLYNFMLVQKRQFDRAIQEEQNVDGLVTRA